MNFLDLEMSQALQEVPKVPLFMETINLIIALASLSEKDEPRLIVLGSGPARDKDKTFVSSTHHGNATAASEISRKSLPKKEDIPGD